jgi:hypothetical protein
LFRAPGYIVAAGERVEHTGDLFVDKGWESAHGRLAVAEEVKVLRAVGGEAVGYRTAVGIAVVDGVLEDVNIPAVDLYFVRETTKKRKQ